MLIEKIESLREKPPHVRNLIAFWIAICVTIVIVGIWAITIPERFAQIGMTATSTQDIRSEIGISENLSPFFTRAKEAFTALTQGFSTTSQQVVPNERTEDIDFKALLASSTLKQSPETVATTSSSSTATSSQATTTASSSVFVPVPVN